MWHKILFILCCVFLFFLFVLLSWPTFFIHSDSHCCDTFFIQFAMCFLLFLVFITLFFLVINSAGSVVISVSFVTLCHFFIITKASWTTLASQQQNSSSNNNNNLIIVVTSSIISKSSGSHFYRLVSCVNGNRNDAKVKRKTKKKNP